jgi:hypothetical protein
MMPPLRRPDHQQKGIMHLMNAILAIDPEMQIVLCAGTPDTPEIAREMEDGVTSAAARGRAMLWVREMVSRPDVVQAQRLSEPAIPWVDALDDDLVFMPLEVPCDMVYPPIDGELHPSVKSSQRK